MASPKERGEESHSPTEIASDSDGEFQEAEVGSSACVASDVLSPWRALAADHFAWIRKHNSWFRLDPALSPTSPAGSAAQGPTVTPQPSPAESPNWGGEEDGGEAVKYQSWEFPPPPRRQGRQRAR